MNFTATGYRAGSVAMDAVCLSGDGVCYAHALAAALHSLNLYCAVIATALICCCSTSRSHWNGKQWRNQNLRGIASLGLGVVWCCGGAAASLRPTDTVGLVAALMAPLAWLAAAAFHISLWTRRSSAPILYLAIYWLLSAASSASVLYQLVNVKFSLRDVEVHIQGATLLLALIISAVDCLCFYDEVTRRYVSRQKSSETHNFIYNYEKTHFYSKITFFWLNSFLCRGYLLPEGKDDIGGIPENESSKLHYDRFKQCCKNQKDSPVEKTGLNIWQCYARMVWPNFYIAAILKLFGDLIGIIPSVGIAVIIQYMEGPAKQYNSNTYVSFDEFTSNGFVMLLIISLALIVQALLSQNSTHLVTVEGTRLKIAVQSAVYDKCMRLASWSVEPEVEEETPLLRNPEEEAKTQSGLLMNLVSQDTYNIMSCVWICHYIWAIPLKVSVILYLLYSRLGISAIIGTATSLLFIMPLQFFIGKKISDNSRNVSKCTDHRVTKISEILQGINVIKLYVWEDLFNEKILQLREVELKLLNRESAYWGFLTFTTQVSTVLVTVVTFTTHYFLEDKSTLTATNVFAGLALFNQLTIPLLILPVTILMMIQATVSTNRIKDFLELPEAFNVSDDNLNIDKSNVEVNDSASSNDDFLDAFEENLLSEREELVYDDEMDGSKDSTELTHTQNTLISIKNSAFSWRMKDNAWLEIDDLEIPAGKLIMVVGSSGSGKSSLLSAILGEMHHERGEVNINEKCSMWYSGQPPWLLEGSIRDNVLMNSVWCASRYARVIRGTGLRSDLQLLPDGDNTLLGSCGAPLSGGQRVRLCIARALYSRARLIVLDEPLGALDAPLARHVVDKGLLPATRAGRTVIVATNRLELLHYADIVVAMEDGRVRECGRVSSTCGGKIGQWCRLAEKAREAASRGCPGPGAAARERDHLLRAVGRSHRQMQMSDDSLPQLGINEVAGAHLLSEVPTCAGGSWRSTVGRVRPPMARQFSTPSPDITQAKLLREIRRAVSAETPNEARQQEESLLRRILPTLPPKTLYRRWTPRTLHRFISSDSDKEIQQNGSVDLPDSTFISVTSNGIEATVPVSEISKTKEPEPVLDESRIWWSYCRACGWWGAAWVVAATATQALALAADWWLARLTDTNDRNPLSDREVWDMIRIYAAWCAGGVCAAACAQIACACAGAASRRKLHERLLHATLHAPLYYHSTHPAGDTLHRFSSDTLVIDKKISTAISRWAQIVLLCGGAAIVNVFISAWTLFALVPAIVAYIALQSVYLRNARELQNIEATSASRAVSLAAQSLGGACTVRAGRLQPRMRHAFQRRLDRNHNALLLLNSANRWLSLSLDLVGAASVFVSLAVALYSGSGGAATGLAGAYSLLLPVYLAHLAKCRADLDLQLAAVQRLITDTDVPQEDYRDDCPIPAGWQRNGKIEFQDVTVQHQPDTPSVLKNINLTINSGQKVAICGRSGSGKSTLVLTCVGATNIRSGRVLLDGRDITQVPLRALRHRVVVLPQEAVMFSGTLRENLDPLAMHTDEEIWSSLKAVGLYDYVSAQPAGLECFVCGWRGAWGGGRGARVCGARAALHARLAAALLLDEPGAALDAAAERALLNAIAAVAPDTTILTVAHRVSSVREYDAAAVLQGGSLIERGAVQSLLAAPASALARLHAAEHALLQLH